MERHRKPLEHVVALCVVTDIGFFPSRRRRNTSWAFNDAAAVGGNEVVAVGVGVRAVDDFNADPDDSGRPRRINAPTLLIMKMEEC